MGTAVWELIDGKQSVQQVIKRFAKKYQLHS
ncbi:MAG: PqqD family protein, partial [Deltaproteobacteria bacterium]|nr:PqqD family protein [Deltaproteobacteria bacterium]